LILGLCFVTVKELQVIRVKKYVEQHDKERIVISHFEVLYDNVTEILGNPVDYKNFKTVNEKEENLGWERTIKNG